MAVRSSEICFTLSSIILRFSSYCISDVQSSWIIRLWYNAESNKYKMAWLVDYVSKIQIGSALALLGSVDINTFQSIMAKQKIYKWTNKNKHGSRLAFYFLPTYLVSFGRLVLYNSWCHIMIFKSYQLLFIQETVLLWRFWVCKILLIRCMDWAHCSPMTPFDVYRSGSTMVRIMACYPPSQYWANVVLSSTKSAFAWGQFV